MIHYEDYLDFLYLKSFESLRRLEELREQNNNEQQFNKPNFMIQKFKKKPFPVEAIQLTAELVIQCYEFVEAKGNFPECGMGIDPEDGKFKVTNNHGVQIVEINDWIIKGAKGEFYPCKPDVFAATYEELELDMAIRIRIEKKDFLIKSLPFSDDYKKWIQKEYKAVTSITEDEITIESDNEEDCHKALMFLGWAWAQMDNEQ